MEDTLAKRHFHHHINLERYYTRGIGNFNLMIVPIFL